MSGWRSIHLDEIAPRPGAGTGADWLALRHTLGVRAFGTNAYRAREAGVEVVERHREADGDERGHEEMYVVLSGRAHFELDGESLDAPAGTVVLVADPRLERVAISREPDTVVLAVGAQPGEAFEPSKWEGRWLAEQPAR